MAINKRNHEYGVGEKFILSYCIIFGSAMVQCWSHNEWL